MEARPKELHYDHDMKRLPQGNDMLQLKAFHTPPLPYRPSTLWLRNNTAAAAPECIEPTYRSRFGGYAGLCGGKRLVL